MNAITEVKDNEDVYDEKIAPLMKQVIAICKEAGIPMFASFLYAPDGFCTTNIPGPKGDEASGKLHRCCELVYQPAHSSTLSITTIGADGKPKLIEHVVIGGGK